MDKSDDILAAERYEREAELQEKSAAEAERLLPAYKEASRGICKDYIDAAKAAAKLSRTLAGLHRERANILDKTRKPVAVLVAVVTAFWTVLSVFVSANLLNLLKSK